MPTEKFEISLDNLRFYAFIGVAPEERQTGNEFRVDLKITIPYNRGIENDELEATVSYADLYQVVEAEMKVRHKLLEKTAAEIVKQLRRLYPQILCGSLKIEKTRPPIPGMLGSAAVCLLF